MDTPLQEIHEKLDRLRFGFRTLCVAHGILIVILILGALALFSFGLDYLIRPPLEVRGVVLLLFGAVLAVLLHRRVVHPLRLRIGREDMARQVEQKNPFLENRLISALQFERLMTDPGYCDSRALSKAVIRETRLLTSNIQFFKVLQPSRVIWLALAPLLFHGFLTAGAMKYPTAFKIWLARNVLLWDVDWPRSTEVDLVIGKAPFRKGSPLTLEVQVGAEITRSILVLGNPDSPSSEWLRIPLVATGEGIFRGEISKPLEGDYFYIETLEGGFDAWLDRAHPGWQSPYYMLIPGEVPDGMFRVELPDRKFVASADRSLPIRALVRGKNPGNLTAWIRHQGSSRVERVEMLPERQEISRGLRLVLERIEALLEGEEGVGDRRDGILSILLDAVSEKVAPNKIQEQIEKLTLETRPQEEILLDLEDLCHEIGIERKEPRTVETGVFVALINKADLRGNFFLHVTGGDDRDDNPIYSVQVQIPPRVRNPIAWVDYPEYTGRIDRNHQQFQEAARSLKDELARIGDRARTTAQVSRIEELEEGVRRLHAAMRISGTLDCPVGSEVHLEALASQPLGEHGSMLFTEKGLEEIPLEVVSGNKGESDRVIGQIPIVGSLAKVDETQFQLQVVGRNGLPNSDPVLHRIRIVKDKKPTFRDIFPTSKSVRRVGMARIPVRAIAVDDYGVTRVEIEFWVEGSPGSDAKRNVQKVVLHDGEGVLPQTEARVEYMLDLEPLRRVERDRVGERSRPLRPGDRVRFLIRAVDGRQIDLAGMKMGPQAGEVGPFEVTIIDKSEVIDSANRLINNLKERIRIVREAQSEIQESTSDILASLLETENLEEGDRKEIEKIQIVQGRRVTTEAIAVANGFQRILEDFRNNNILEEKPRNLDEMIPLIGEVAENLSPGVEEGLRLAGAADAPSQAAEESKGAHSGQIAVLEKLDSLLALLEEWENYNEIIRAWRELKTRQDRLKEKTSKRFQ